MKKIVLSFLLALLFILSLNSLIKVNGEDLYLHEVENYNDFGNTINQAQEFEYNLIGDNSFKYAVPVNTMYSFGFKYKLVLLIYSVRHYTVVRCIQKTNR